MSKICVTGMRNLQGNIRTPGAKNAVLPMIAAALLTNEEVTLLDCPKLSDVRNMLAIMKMLGCSYECTDDAIHLDTAEANKWEMPEELAKELRSSIFMLGPVIARFRKACFTYPGGCEIGNRPIDLHIKGLRALNVDVLEEHGYIICDGSRMHGADIHLDYPSVGATENIMMAAISAPGKTVIRNAAREPEIWDLQQLLVHMGAKIYGAGSSTILIEGGGQLHGVAHRMVPDRITAGTWMVAAAITGGEVTVENVQCEHLHSVLAKLRECDCKIDVTGSSVRVRGPERPKEMELIETMPYPGFPTDMQAQFFALASVADGTSIIVENVFENRFKHAGELIRMGGLCTVKDRMAIVRGVNKLTGAEVKARDLRGGAALVLAALRAEGRSVIDGAEYIDRGYECIEESLSRLGAQISRIP